MDTNPTDSLGLDAVAASDCVAGVYIVRPALASDLPAILDVYAACCRKDSDYLPFLDRGDRGALSQWFVLKPMAVCLVVTWADVVVGLAGLRAAPPQGSAPGAGPWLEACRLAVHPDHRGGPATRVLTAARIEAARRAGARQLWLRCVDGSPAHLLYIALGWRFLARTQFADSAACQNAVLLQLRLTPAT